MSASTGFAPHLRPFDPDAALRLWALPVLVCWTLAAGVDAFPRRRQLRGAVA